MSDKTSNLPAVIDTPVEETQKPSLYRRGVEFVKTHKKTTIAVGLGAGLIGLAAVTGRKQEPLPTFDSVVEDAEEPESDSDTVD